MKLARLLVSFYAGLVLVGCSTTHEPHASNQQSAVLGVWYMAGDAAKPCHVWASTEGLHVENEFALSSRLVFDQSGVVVAVDWEGKLRGHVKDGTILWENGSWWTRAPSR